MLRHDSTNGNRIRCGAPFFRTTAPSSSWRHQRVAAPSNPPLAGTERGLGAGSKTSEIPWPAPAILEHRLGDDEAEVGRRLQVMLGGPYVRSMDRSFLPLPRMMSCLDGEKPVLRHRSLVARRYSSGQILPPDPGRVAPRRNRIDQYWAATRTGSWLVLPRR